MQDEVEGQDVRGFVALDGTGHDALEVSAHALRRDFAYEQVIGGAVGSEEGDVGDITFIA